MPQIAQLAETYASQVFWLLLFFGFTFFVIGRGMVPKVMATVDLRERQISDDLAAAEAARKPRASVSALMPTP
jgi:F-type H+-transporting ATPase subunit b